MEGISELEMEGRNLADIQEGKVAHDHAIPVNVSSKYSQPVQIRSEGNTESKLISSPIFHLVSKLDLQLIIHYG